MLSTSLLLVAHSADAAEALPLDVFAAFLVRALACSVQLTTSTLAGRKHWPQGC